MSRDYFDQLADALVGFLRPEYRAFRRRVSSRNVKVWYGEVANEHYEAQFLRGRKLELGFHVEYPSADISEQTLKRVLAAERRWRKQLGPEPQSGAFLGMESGPWRRVSEVWEGAGVDTPEAAIEAAERLAGYIHALEPVRLGAFAPEPKTTSARPPKATSARPPKAGR